MAEESYKQVDLAARQLEMALNLFLDKICLSSSITLAGAAEEVFGRSAARTGTKPILEELYESAATIHRELYPKKLDKKVFIEEKNRARNALKHLQEDCDEAIVVDLEDAACWMLVRALDNARRAGIQISRESEFDEWFYENIVGG